METMNYLKTSGLDIIVLILYFCVLVGNGIYFSYKKAKELKKVKGDTEAENFLVGGKSFGVFATLCTQGASMKGSGALLGYSGGAYVNGAGTLIPGQCYSLGAWFSIACGMARKLRKCADKLNITSVGDVLFYKYGMTYQLALVIGIIVSFSYVSIGGLVSVVYNDVFQWLIMTPMIFIVLPGAMILMHGVTPSAMHSTLDAAQFFSLRPNMWWLGYLLSGVLASCCDVTHVQRFISAKDEKTSVKGSMLGFAYCTLFAGVITFLGLGAAMIVEPAVLGGNNDGVIFALISEVLPHGLIGLFIAAILATTISTLDSYLQVCVLCLMVDVVEPVLPKGTTEKQKLTYCRVLTFAIAVAASLLVLQFKGILTIVAVGYSTFSSMMFLPFMCALFWKRCTGQGCIAGMISGCAVCSVAVWMKLPLPIVWGVIASFVCLVGVSLTSAKEARSLLPGFDEHGLEIDNSVLKACVFGTIGSLLISIGIGMWINWICIITGIVGMYLCVTMIDKAFGKYMLRA
ncbi:sodium:solute symporter family protein [Cloacibacillus porcorum]|uniref:sodium:solute symporter family protein n=1 Tax=Cloacibacillus porcorum TaxID=1197717 RepID=UPI0023F36691|nr:sodium:solute symporter family protein [Cloacibacillus porcorum]MCC8184534.1 sodium:solute symporter family protein [Cloacibacillus porcorum]